MSEKNPEIVGATQLELRSRGLLDKHFEFRDVEVPNVVDQHQRLSVSRWREARLRPEYGQVYPWLFPDTGSSPRLS